MSIMIEITSTEIKTRSGTSTRTGNAYSMREQIGYLHKPAVPYPEKIKIMLEENQLPYNLGNYSLSSESFYVDKYDSIAVRPILIPRPAEQPQQNSSLPDGVTLGRKAS